VSILRVSPEVVTAAAGNLENIGSAMSAANVAAMAPTTGLVSMAADQVSAAVTAAFTSHAQQYQALGEQAAAFHTQFVRTVSSGALAYLSSEIANAEQALINAVNGPAIALLGHPLIPTRAAVGQGAGSVVSATTATSASGAVSTSTAASGTTAASGGTTASTGTAATDATAASAGTTASTGTAATDVTTASSGATVSTGTAVTGVTAISSGSGTVVTAGTIGATDATTVGTAVGVDTGTTVTATPVATAPVIDPVTGVAVTGATGGTATLLDSAPATIPLINTNTPFGPVSLTLSGTADLITGQVTIDSGSIALPAPLALSFDALGPYYLAMNSLQHSGTAFVSAMQHGNVLGAANALFFAPTNAMGGFFFGHDTISQTVAAPGGSGYTSVGFQVPVGGLLSPLQPLTLTLTPTGGAPTNVALDGTQVGGFVPGLLSLFPGF